MLDPKLLREHIDTVAQALNRRGFVLDKEQFIQQDQQYRALQTQLQQCKATKNAQAKAVGRLKAQGQCTQAAIAEVSSVSAQIKALESDCEQAQARYEKMLWLLPNLPDETVPDGQDESQNQLVRSFKTPTPFDFPAKDHVALGERAGWIDFAAGAKLSGARFCVLNGPLAQLSRALSAFMLDVHVTEHGYHEVDVPYLVSEKCLYGTGQLPKFAEDQFTIAGDWDLTLIPTAEVPVTNLFREEIIDYSRLPLKVTAHTPCFRSEAGSYGRDTKGLIRQHQFHKVELVQVVAPDQSDQALESITKAAETILQRLDLPYRVMALCAGDLGFSAAKTYDLEVWLPGQSCYREISSCSNFKDFQARRMQLRYRDPHAQKPQIAHTLNGSGLAVGRTLVAVMENYQQPDGSIVVPEALQPYMRGQKVIT